MALMGVLLTGMFIVLVVVMVFGAKAEKARRYARKPYKGTNDSESGSAVLPELPHHDGGEGGSSD